MPFDIFNDKQFSVLAKLKSRCDFPEFSKEASVASEDTKELPDHCFAWPEKRAFPINSKADSYLSNIYFMATAAGEEGQVVPSYVYDNLEKAASIFELEEDLEKVASSLKRKPKQKALSSDFGLFEKVAGKTVAKYPLLDGEQVKKASQHFQSYHNEFTPEQKRTISDNILIKAAKFGVTITDPIVFQSSGCSQDIDLNLAIDEVEKRAHRNKNTAFAPAFEKLAESLKTVTASDIQGVRDLQDKIAHLDKQAGLDRYYGRYYRNPIELAYGAKDMSYMFKEAENTVSIGNSKVSLATLMSVPKSLYEDILGADATQEMCVGGELEPDHVANVIPTLPLPEATFLKERIDEMGL